MRARPLLSLLVALSSLAACGKEEPFREVCELSLSCDCSPPRFTDVDGCITELTAQEDALKSAAAADGLTYSKECTDKLVGIYTDFECSKDVVESGSCSLCFPVHGGQPEGAACTEYDAGSDCAKNLLCSNGACVDPCKTLASGEPCWKDAASLGACAQGLYCDVANSGTCTAQIGPGGKCPDYAGCAEGLQCGGDFTCQALPGQGEDCIGSCAADLVCQMNTCQPAPTAGQPCASGRCAAGAGCENEVCVEDQPLVCFLGKDA